MQISKRLTIAASSMALGAGSFFALGAVPATAATTTAATQVAPATTTAATQIALVTAAYDGGYDHDRYGYYYWDRDGHRFYDYGHGGYRYGGGHDGYRYGGDGHGGHGGYGRH
jgi:hypothetical protein